MDLPLSVSEYTYAFDEKNIANYPSPNRDDSRLLIVRRNPSKGLPRFEDVKFTDLPKIVDEIPELKKHLWVRNRTKVLPARIFAIRATGGRHEIVLTERSSDVDWKAIIKNVSKITIPETLIIEGSNERILVTAPDEIQFRTPSAITFVERVGRIPLPPYIKRESVEQDRKRYQSVWATGEALSSAAPTASLHFTEAMWENLTTGGVKSADVFLHVGRGTFESLRTNDLATAELHSEAFEVAAAEVEKIRHARSVLAVGSTSLRLVETLNLPEFSGRADDIRGKTNLFVKPGYKFKQVEALLTNFHLPESSLFILVSVFAGSLKLAKEAYEHAIKKDYRLFSYGDASLWI